MAKAEKSVSKQGHLQPLLLFKDQVTEEKTLKWNIIGFIVHTWQIRKDIVQCIISNDNRTDWSLILPVIIQVKPKSDNYAAGV